MFFNCHTFCSKRRPYMNEYTRVFDINSLVKYGNIVERWLEEFFKKIWLRNCNFWLIKSSHLYNIKIRCLIHSFYCYNIRNKNLNVVLTSSVVNDYKNYERIFPPRVFQKFEKFVEKFQKYGFLTVFYKKYHNLKLISQRIWNRE